LRRGKFINDFNVFRWFSGWFALECTRMKPLFIAAAFLAMSLASFLDNLRGPLLPLLSHRLGLPYGQASWFFGIGNLAAVVGLFTLLRYSERISDRALTIFLFFSASLASVALFAVNSFATFLLAAVLWGATISLLGALGNTLMIHGTDVHKRGRFFCGLHMMYGLASFVAPFVVAQTVAKTLPFESSPLWLLPFLLVLGGLGLKLGKKHGPTTAAPKHRLNTAQIWILILFGSYVAGEVLLSTWMVTYLVDFQRTPMTGAASVLSLFFLMMGLSRGLCFLSLPPAWEGRLLWVSISIALVGGIVGRFWWTPALALAGLVGPFFPLIMARTSRVFPEVARSLTLWILGTTQFTLVCAQWITGQVADRFGIQNAFLMPNLFFVVSAVSLFVYLQLEKKAA